MNDIGRQKEEQRNIFIAMVLVIVVLFSFQFFGKKDNGAPSAESEAPVVAAAPAPAVPAPADKNTLLPTLPVVDVQAIPVANAVLSGMLGSRGGQVSDVSLLRYRETPDKDSAPVVLLKPGEAVSVSWTGMGLPEKPGAWAVSGNRLTPQTPVALTYQTPSVKIERVIELDEHYMMTLTDRVINLTDAPVAGVLAGSITRAAPPESARIAAVFEGFVGYFDGKLFEESYASVDKDAFSKPAAGGWTGITDKYWQTILIPPPDALTMTYQKTGDRYVAGFQTAALAVPARQSIERTTRVFIGAKEAALINRYQESLNIPRFDLTIDYGWYYFLTKPFLAFLAFLFKIFGNMGVAILIFATLLRIAMLPIATKSYESMAKMRRIQPKIKELQERHKDNKMLMQQELMALYKRDKVNPMAGCLPMLIQIPIFFALYKVLSVSILMRQAPFFGWIQDLSQPDPTSLFTAFGLIPWNEPMFLHLGIWPILMGITMYIQQKMQPQPTDPTQANVMKFLPLLFTFMMANFASGLVIYWTWSNILSIAQQKYIMKKMKVD
ncbi:MAG: membrane protein insertase YidC [Alphaproteobacteria bacterium]|nr:membrane protein insertase YidC [Alphaproteobacteria bacterium]